jgi:Ca2+-binding EF-hand superfamily protein
VSVPSEESFIKLVETSWGLSEDEQSVAFVDKVKELMTMMRQRLRTLSNQTEEEFKLRQIFKTFDLNNSGTITIDELAAMMAKLGIVVDRKYVNALLRALDTNHNNMIEFEEFTNLVLYDPYK